MRAFKKFLNYGGRVAAIAGLVCLPFIAGCEDKDNDDDYQNSETNQPSGGSGEDRTGSDSGNPENTIPDTPSGDSNLEKLCITYPTPSSDVKYRDTMRGGGLYNFKSGVVIVHTDRDYLQVGTFHVNGDGSWTYSPIYFGSTHFTINLTVEHTDNSKESASVSSAR